MTAIQRFRLALVAQILVLVLGITGYMAIEGWSAFDALYMTVITLATIGYSETRPLHDGGRAFTILLIVAGVSTGAFTAAAFAEMVLGNVLRETLERRRMEHRLEHLADHFLICGWGRIGREVAAEFVRHARPFVIIELDDAKCRALAQQGLLYVQGDAADDAVLRHAGVERARGLVAVAPRDADNIFITLSARALNRNLFIVARSIYEQDAHKLEIAGANRVISPYVIGARRIAATVFHPTVVDFLDLGVHREQQEWELDEVPLTEDSPLAGKTLRTSGIRENSGCTVLAIRAGETRRINSNPHPDTALRAGDTLIVLGQAEQLRRLHASSGKRT